jgi:DNA-binding transcriptional LysR family regulator
MWPTTVFPWQLIQTFLIVKRHRSVQTASLLLGVSVSTIRRHIKQLEFLCGNRLFIANSRGLSPTQLAMDLGLAAERIAGLADAFVGAAARNSRSCPANEP